MALVNLCSRVDDLYAMLKQSEGGEEMFPEFVLDGDDSGSDEEVSKEPEAKLPPQDQDALNALIAELCRHPELKSYKLSHDDLCVIANLFHASGTQYNADFNCSELFGFLPPKPRNLKDKFSILLSLIDREVLSLSYAPDADFHHDVNHVFQSCYRLNGLLWNIILGKAPVKSAVASLSRGLRSGGLIQDAVSDALATLFDYYPELRTDLKNIRGIYYGKTVNTLLDKALAMMNQFGENQPFKELCETCLPDLFWQRCLLLIYHFHRSGKDLEPASLAVLLTQGASAYKGFLDLWATDNCLKQKGLLGSNSSLFGFEELCLSEAAKAKLTSTPAAKNESIEAYLQQTEYFSLIKPEQDLEQLILAKEAMQNIVAVIDRLKNPNQNLLLEWGLRGASLSDDVDVNNGCNILLHGEPGTGKTYIAGVLANQLQRPLLMINASNIRNYYYGATEKKARDLFQQMRYLAEKYHPVFLLNEGDQLIHHRSEGARSGAENAENTLQSIWLEELETFNGILLVTSNLVTNLDPAMSRRFHYNLTISAPDYEARLKLWKLHLPESIPGAREIELEPLAEGFQFTGGQIRNVVLNACHQASCREGSRVLESSDLWQYACLEGATNFEGRAKRVGF